MTEAAKNLSTQARKLSPAERLELVDDLLTSLDEITTTASRRGLAMRFCWKPWRRSFTFLLQHLADDLGELVLAVGLGDVARICFFRTAR